VIPAFAQRRTQWSSPPIDDIGYIPSKDLMTWDDGALVDLINEMEHSRYLGWRNFEGRWRRVLGLDTTFARDVLDYGCGVGLESLQYARNENRVTVADISGDNISLALRVLKLFEVPAAGHWLIPERPASAPSTMRKFDVVHCCGVLHHIPNAEDVVKALHSRLRAEGELRLMVYSDEAWRIATGTEPPLIVDNHPKFERYWQHWDPIGGYADWYNAERLESRFGRWFTIEQYEPLTEHGEYVGAVMVKR